MVTKVTRKTLKIRYSGRSSDYITPSFGHGCLYKCAYCYMRRHKPNDLSVATNIDDILNSVVKHHNKLENKVNLIASLKRKGYDRKAYSLEQTHSSMWSYDISCNEDFALHLKYYDWNKILNTLTERDIFPTFATKYVNNNLLSYNPNRKARIRFSLMPQYLSSILEPNTSKIIDRIKAINKFYEAGWDVHINFSPIIINKGTKNMYSFLFKQINAIVKPDIRSHVKAECIMLTHNESMHNLNLRENPKAEEILWQPDRQEDKITNYGNAAIRYDRIKKRQYINQFKKLHSEIIPWNEIRYIF